MAMPRSWSCYVVAAKVDLVFTYCYRSVFDWCSQVVTVANSARLITASNDINNRYKILHSALSVQFSIFIRLQLSISKFK